MTVFEIYNTFIGAAVTISACPIRGSRPGWKATLTHNGAVIARCSGMGMSRAEVKAHVETLWGLDVATQKAPLEYNRTVNTWYEGEGPAVACLLLQSPDGPRLFPATDAGYDEAFNALWANLEGASLWEVPAKGDKMNVIGGEAFWIPSRD